MSETKPFAEVSTSSLSELTGLCWDHASPPPFGSLVRVSVQDKTLLGIVHDVKTGNLDDTRTPQAFRKTPEELAQDHPHIFAFIQTTFHVTMLCYKDHGKVHALTPPFPAPIHTWIYPLEEDEALSFIENPTLIRRILLTSQGPYEADMILLGLLRNLHKTTPLSKERVKTIAQAYAQEIHDDYHRTRNFIHHLEAFIEITP